MENEKIASTEEMHSRPIMMSNNGDRLIETDYFDHPIAKAGIFFITCNAGALRLLVPDSKLDWLSEMKTGKKVEIEIEPNIIENIVSLVNGEMEGRDKLSIFFEDYSKKPFCIQLGSDQCDRRLKPGKCKFHVYTREGLQLKFKCKILIPNIEVKIF